MAFQFEDISQENVFETLLQGLDQQVTYIQINLKKEILSSLLYILKCSIFKKILETKSLSEQIRLNCLPIFLDEKTRYFNFLQHPKSKINSNIIIESIIIMIANLCPNIEKIDISAFKVPYALKGNFKNLLRTCSKLECLYVQGNTDNCAIMDLLLNEDLSNQRDIQNALEKIESLYYSYEYMTPIECAKILKLLPNLQSLGDQFFLGEGLHLFVALDSNSPTLNLTEINDKMTSLKTLEIIAKFCPKVTVIYLAQPQAHVLESLSKLPLLTELRLQLFSVYELITYLKQHGKNIRKLLIYGNDIDYSGFNFNSLRQYCHESLEIKINDRIG